MQLEIDENIKNENLIIVYGFDEDYYLFLKQKLKKKHLVFIEDDPLVSKKDIFKKILQDKNVDIFFDKKLENILEKIAWKYSFLIPYILASPFYKKEKFLKFLKIKKLLLKYFDINFLLTSYLSDFGKKHFKNVFLNLINAKKIYLAESFKNSCKNIPAIICGAGPSLKKNISYLKKLKKRTFIFAGGTAGEILEKKGIPFDFLAHIDGNAFLNFSNKNIPFLYQNKMYWENLKYENKILVNEEKIFPLEEWINKELSIDQKNITSGWTVASFLISFASFLGCSPIIFVGLDFSYKDKKYPFLKKNEQKKAYKNTLGGKVFTQRDWQAEINWIERFILNDKNTFYHTEKESLFKKMRYKPIDDFLKLKILKKDVGEILKEIDSFHIEENKVLDVLNILKKSIKRCYEISSLALNTKDFEKAFFDIKDEIFFKKHLLFIWNVFSFILKREIPMKTTEDIWINQMIFFRNVSFEFLKLFIKSKF